GIIRVSREVGYFEYVSATTAQGIEIRYYEDGLYIFQLATNDIEAATAQLRQYYHDLFEPALSYIFSLGAPTPKVLANLKSEHQVVVHEIVKNIQDVSIPEGYGQV